MSLHDKLLPWRSKRSSTSLARICVRNALQMGKQLPYSRVRLFFVVVLSQKIFSLSRTEWVHYDLWSIPACFPSCRCYSLFLLPYSSLKLERVESREKHLCLPLKTSQCLGKLKVKSSFTVWVRMEKKPQSLSKCLASSLYYLNTKEGADTNRDTLALWWSFTTFLRELFQVPAGVIAF